MSPKLQTSSQQNFQKLFKRNKKTLSKNPDHYARSLETYPS